MTNEAQWTIAGGTLGAYQEARKSVQKAITEADKIPEVLYEHAPDAYAKMLLPNLRLAADWLEWSIRVTIDEALATSSVSQRELAAAAGIALTTVQRWSKEPALMADEGGFGPGTIPDGRRRSSRSS